MPGDPVLMGIDIGTSGSKGVIVALNGDVVAEHSTSHGFDIPRPGWAEHDADAVWWHDFCVISRALLDKAALQPGQLIGVGCSAIAPTMLPLDAQFRPLRPAILYGIDVRAAAEIDDLTNDLGAEVIFAHTGQYLSSQSVGPKVLWYKRNEPELYARTRKIVTAATYLVYRLTGRFVVDNYVAPYFTPFFDVQKLAWDAAFTERICPVEWLPETLWSTESAGVVTHQAAEATGLPAGIPVAVGTADAAAEAISIGAIDPGDMMVMYGTTMFLIQALDTYRKHPDLWASVYCIPGQAALAAGMSTSGALIRWFRDQFGQPEIEIERQSGVSAYKQLSDQAAGISAGSNGLITLPYFSGERTPINDPHARGLIMGLTLTHERAHILRSCLEGIAYGLRHNIETMASVDALPKRLVAVGGGVNDELWLQICSDVTNMPQEIPERTMGAAYGDAYLAGYAAGVFADSKPLREQWVRIARTIQPDPAASAVYDELY
ncbi:MAG: FGGY-family carbohydrate kinase, partial [Chloroflexi bacterium]|nr:FGGY-family carbohydrate kinase [Chloroflexota bacterium]